MIPIKRGGVQKTLTHDLALTPIPVPILIEQGKSYLFTMKEETKHGATIVLTYSCGDKKSVTFLSHSNMGHTITPKHPLFGTVQSQENMRAYVIEKRAPNNTNSYMSWVLEPEFSHKN